MQFCFPLIDALSSLLHSVYIHITAVGQVYLMELYEILSMSLLLWHNAYASLYPAYNSVATLFQHNRMIFRTFNWNVQCLHHCKNILHTITVHTVLSFVLFLAGYPHFGYRNKILHTLKSSHLYSI